MLQRRRARVQVGVTGKETALSRGQRRSHSVSAPRFSAIKLDQTGIQWRQRLNFTVPSCTVAGMASICTTAVTSVAVSPWVFDKNERRETEWRKKKHYQLLLVIEIKRKTYVSLEKERKRKEREQKWDVSESTRQAQSQHRLERWERRRAATASEVRSLRRHVTSLKSRARLWSCQLYSTHTYVSYLPAPPQKSSCELSRSPFRWSISKT